MQFKGNMPQCGQWRLVREIGHGAYGVVYLAVGSDGKRAAVKVCRREEIGEERYARELRGARLYSAIPRTDGLVCMKELVEKPWGFYTVMDLADHEFDGEFSEETYRPKTLASIMEGEKALSLDESVELGIALAKGLETLQRHHLLHRDIKPGNVIYVGGRPVLSDPGLVVEESEAASLVGTPGYVPPENFTAAVGDVYSLGLTLKAASFGRGIEDLDKGPALEADTSAAQFPAWWRILNKATDPTPSRRCQSAKALLKDLEGLRRKIAFASIVGSSATKGAIALVVLGVVAVVTAFIISSERTKDELARRTEENKSLTDNFTRQSAEIKSLKEDIVRQTAEIQPLRDDIAKRSEENKSLKDTLDRQSRENKELKGALDRQSDENKALKDDLSRQSEEIKLLKNDIANHPMKSNSLTEKEVESLKDFKSQMQFVKYIVDARNYFAGVIKGVVDLYRINRRLCGLLRDKINNADEGGEKENWVKVQSELQESRQKVRDLLVRLYRLRRHFEEKLTTIDGATRQAVEEKLLAAQKLVNEGVPLEKRLYEIGGMIYGEENWKPNQFWIGLGGDYWDEHSIYKESLLDKDQENKSRDILK